MSDSPEDEPALRGMLDGGIASPGEEKNPFLSRPLVLSDEDVEHTVWDEPTLTAHHGAGEPPEGELTYRRWLAEGIAQTSAAKSWLITLGLVLVAGPLGILGAFTAGSTGSEVSLAGVLAVAVLAPVTEEITKIAGALWVVEKRPHWFKSFAQIQLAAVAGGLAFAAIENLIYIYVYAPDGGEAFRAWRWTVCTGLHVSCSSLAGWGLVRTWSKTLATGDRPDLRLAYPLIAAAMVTHGLYNFGATVAEATGWLTFE